MKSSSKHWDSIFSTTQDSKLGWYEQETSKTFELLNQIPNWAKSTLFIPGAGTSILIEQLYNQGAHLILNDISLEALNQLKAKMPNAGHKITWICQDISRPIQNATLTVDIWIDRAVLHFLTNEVAIDGYFNNIESTLKVGGYAIFAQFSKTGSPKCAGLTLHRYSIEELSARLGASFKLIANFDDTFISPNGDAKPYIYGLYQRIR
jgi:2-polyprenyl-3-methyl-5-hydroxy-6-metoxy-1,4-benzoquinol methylase